MKYLVVLAGLITALMVSSCASAMVIYFWDEDFENIPLGDISTEKSTYYDTYATVSGNPELFYDDWNAHQGSGPVVQPVANKFLQVWHTGLEGNWGKCNFGSHITDNRPNYHSPMVVEYTLRPGYNPGGEGYEDSGFADKVTAMKWRFAIDELTFTAGSKVGWKLHYDGWLYQVVTGIPASRSVDVGTMSGSGMDIWDRTKDDWLYFKCYLDPEAGYIKTYLSADATIDDLDVVFSTRTYNWTDDLRYRQLQDCQGGSGTGTVGGGSEPDCRKADFDDIKVYFTEAYPAAFIEGTVTVGYPGYEQMKIQANYQLRNPGLPPTEPVDEGFIWIQEDTDPIRQRAVSFQAGPFTAGTYDFAMKHLVNHVADMATNLDLSAGDVTGLALTLWGGDSDGDDNAGNYEGTADPYKDNEGDNDVDFYDYYTLYYQYLGSVGLTEGYNADFDKDNDVDFYDYYSLYYGYLDDDDPGNWYYAP